jgi:hypothetical protein
VHAGHDVHAVLVADGLQRLADVAAEGGAREVRVQRLAVDRVGAGAGAQDDAGDGRLALAGRAVARARGEVDDGGDRRLVGAVLLGLGLGGSVGLLLRERVGALEDDVDLEVGTRDRGLLARGSGSDAAEAAGAGVSSDALVGSSGACSAAGSSSGVSGLSSITRGGSPSVAVSGPRGDAPARRRS